MLFRVFAFMTVGCCICFVSPCYGQASPDTARSAGSSTGNVRPRADFRKMVDTLANQNETPRILGDIPDEVPLFPEGYSWKEQDRVLGVLQALTDHVTEAWPALIQHLDDDRYCITFDQDQSVANMSIGGICRILLWENITAAYMDKIPKGQFVFSRLRRPRYIRDSYGSNTGFKEWCLEQQKEKKELYQLQIDACLWAVKEITTRDDVSDEDKDKSIKAIKREVEILRRSRTPKILKSVMLKELRIPFSEKRALEIRSAQSSR